jgi:hypothetical protein
MSSLECEMKDALLWACGKWALWPFCSMSALVETQCKSSHSVRHFRTKKQPRPIPSGGYHPKLAANSLVAGAATDHRFEGILLAYSKQGRHLLLLLLLLLLLIMLLLLLPERCLSPFLYVTAKGGVAVCAAFPVVSLSQRPRLVIAVSPSSSSSGSSGSVQALRHSGRAQQWLQPRTGLKLCTNAVVVLWAHRDNLLPPERRQTRGRA